MKRPRGVGPSNYLIERIDKFLTNDWVHLERKVASMDGKIQLIIAMMTVMVGLMIYAVVK